MTTRQGTCALCGQDRMVEVPEGASQLTVDTLATEECTCAGAMEERHRKKTLAKTEAAIERMFEAYGDDTLALLCGVTPYLIDGTISKASFVLDEETTAIMTAKGNAVRVERKRLLVETAE